MGRILAEDYSGVTSLGAVESKAQALADLEDQSATVESCVDSDVKVRLYGDTAVVTGLGNRSGTRSGVAFKDRKVRWTDTFVKRDMPLAVRRQPGHDRGGAAEVARQKGHAALSAQPDDLIRV